MSKNSVGRPSTSSNIVTTAKNGQIDAMPSVNGYRTKRTSMTQMHRAESPKKKKNHKSILVECLRQIKAGKQRPNLKRIIWSLNKNQNLNIKSIIANIFQSVKEGVVLKAFVKGEYTYVDIESDSRNPMPVTKDKDISPQIISSVRENPKGSTIEQLKNYAKIRFLMQPVGLKQEDLVQKIEKTIKSLIDNDSLSWISENKLYLSQKILKQTNNMEKSEVLPVCPPNSVCQICKQIISDDMGLSGTKSLSYIWCKSCGSALHTFHSSVVTEYVIEHFSDLHWECETCRLCIICRDLDEEDLEQ
ncbi:MAG: Histone acetyltransferase kat6b [Paramarteilia canceri]